MGEQRTFVLRNEGVWENEMLKSILAEGEFGTVYLIAKSVLTTPLLCSPPSQPSPLPPAQPISLSLGISASWARNLELLFGTK